MYNNELVIIDPGHGGHDSGAVSGRFYEKEIVLVKSIACKQELERHDVNVELIRSDDTFVGLQDRSFIANSKKADIFVSIHDNAGGGDGAEVYYSILGGASQELAQGVLTRICTETGQNSRGIKTKLGTDGRDYYSVIRETAMPAIIVEGAFLDNQQDVQIIDELNEQEAFGIAIAHGILDYYEIPIKPRKVVEAKQTKDFSIEVKCQIRELEFTQALLEEFQNILADERLNKDIRWEYIKKVQEIIRTKGVMD